MFYKRRYISNYQCSLIAIRNFFYSNKCYTYEETFTDTQWIEKPWPVDKFKDEDFKLFL